MKIHKLFWAIAVALISFTACSSDDECTDSQKTGGVRFTGSVGDYQSKLKTIGSTQWAQGDAVGIYMKSAGVDLATGIISGADNIKHTTPGDGVFTGATQNITFPTDGSKVDFIAYYPFKDGINGFTYPINVANQTNLPSIDLLYSNNAIDHNNASTSVAMNFKHMLSMLVLNLSAGDGVASLDGIKLSISDAHTDGTFDLKTGSVTLGSTKASITPAISTTSGTVVNTILVPRQNLSGLKFTFTLNGKTYVWTPDPIVLESGKKYTIGVQVSLTGLTILNPSGTIQDWDEGYTGGAIIVTPEEETGTSFSVDNTTINFQENVLSNILKLTAPVGQAWTATSSAAWLTVNPAGGTGSANLTLTADVNSVTTSRTATITIAGPSGSTIAPITISVIQEAKAVAGSFSLSSSSVSLTEGASDGTILLTAPTGQAWAVASNASWLTVTPTSGAGNASLKVSSQANTGAERTATVTVSDPASTIGSVTFTVTQKAKAVTPTASLVFPGSDFEDWSAFSGALKYELKYASKNETGGMDGSVALHLNETPAKNDYVFTASLKSTLTGSPSKISFYIKGTSTSKTLSINIFGDGNSFKAFNLGDVTGAVTIDPIATNSYTGVINTNNQWVKVTLNLSSIPLNTQVGQDIFALKVGKDSAYNLLVDNIVFE